MSANLIAAKQDGESEMTDIPRHRLDFGLSTNVPEPKPVLIALVDDEEGVHQLLQKTLKKYAQAWTLESYVDGQNALTQMPQSPPDAVLMDVLMPGITGIECTRRLKTLFPDLPIVILSAHMDAEMLLNSMMAGASGALFKPAAPVDIMGALRKAMTGSMTLCPRAEKAMMECFGMLGKNYQGWQLTGREQEVMTCICQQKTDKEIGETLGIGSGTVHVHISSIFKKLNVHSRADAIRKIMSVNQVA